MSSTISDCDRYIPAFELYDFKLVETVIRNSNVVYTVIVVGRNHDLERPVIRHSIGVSRQCRYLRWASEYVCINHRAARPDQCYFRGQ
ncbi:hypothetical protein CLAFUW4_01725 [Fulvia fulva]|uniref:Uncharacterized protein n=1 Tax=Passalora fulva TaxID=5499 RepID=A0A9Q8L556_PASFU|nr:uncharacterized protein CLAFUR5_01721 [Fulvia fulva]KAK4635023.1 hypothetical protein CLAFUR4_01723 [Fulvia fulva]KAK4636564.1 hypothetical protein CLAFUR0_01724 [Fulvia fulva]UJO10977.1 hypothetical protein CLAFUR5_01721 [Fulvia fulva]WPV08604.1 hypothetical protein CLAFUW4_01725 [Fulvia fulva]WPV24439.1 hypothetical protein CLAFUW7_01727 [Fulvia fulva]